MPHDKFELINLQYGNIDQDIKKLKKDSGRELVLFDFVDYGTASVIQQQIEITLENFEPRIDNVSVEGNPRPDLNEFEVTVYLPWWATRNNCPLLSDLD